MFKKDYTIEELEHKLYNRNMLLLCSIIPLMVFGAASIIGIFEWAESWWQYLVTIVSLILWCLAWWYVLDGPVKLEKQIAIKRGYYIDYDNNKVYVDENGKDVKKVPAKIVYDE